MKKRDFWQFPWYVVLISLYAPLSLFAHNLGQLEINAANRALLLSASFTFLLLWVFSRWLKDVQKAGLLISTLLVLFFSYGHIYLLLKNMEVAGILIGRHRYLVLVWGILAVLAVWWVLKKAPSNIPALSLNLIALVLIFFPLNDVIRFQLKNRAYLQARAEERQVETNPVVPAAENLPDIYYIILDGYGRSDWLQTYLDYDNSAFLDDLEALGFYVARCSQSNYAKTDLSLASSLNMNYVTALDESLTSDNTDRAPLWTLTKHSEVAEKLRQKGYKVRSFETGFDFTQIEPVDTFYVTPRRGFNAFENLLLETSFAVLLDDAGLLSRYQLTNDDYKYHRILFTLDTTANEIPQLEGPDFVFVHLLVPHQPFVFGPDGELSVVDKVRSNRDEYYSEEGYTTGYRNQAVFISKRITEVAQSIIEKSDPAPIIIIQGDHGPSHFTDEARVGILNAYYFPGHEVEFTPTLTPVNSFRLLFSTYFNENYPLLEDKSYYSTYPNAYEFTPIPNQCEP